MKCFEINITATMPKSELLALSEKTHIDELYVYSDKTITTQFTRLLKNIGSVKELIVRNKITRTALRDCFAIKGLQSLVLFDELVAPGKYINASKAMDLKVVNHRSASEIDLRIFSRLPNLTEIVAHRSEWSLELLTRFISKPLVRLEVEDSYISDDMAAIIATSDTIVSLSIGNSGLTGKGLAQIAKMQQLESLDIWNTKIEADDLTVLTKMQNLNYLSIGGYYGHQYLDMQKAISIILKIPNLTSLWVDGVALTDEQLNCLNQHIKTVCYDADDYD